MSRPTNIRIPTASVTINPAFLQEIKEVHQELWQLVVEARSAVSQAVPAPAQHRGFIDLLVRLRDQLALHFSLEEAYGYFEGALDVAPRLCRRAESLRAEHTQIYMKVCQLVDQAERLLHPDPDAGLAHCVVDLFRDFLEQFESHEVRENELIQEEFNDDIGVGD